MNRAAKLAAPFAAPPSAVSVLVEAPTVAELTNAERAADYSRHALTEARDEIRRLRSQVYKLENDVALLRLLNKRGEVQQ